MRLCDRCGEQATQKASWPVELLLCTRCRDDLAIWDLREGTYYQSHTLSAHWGMEPLNG